MLTSRHKASAWLRVALVLIGGWLLATATLIQAAPPVQTPEDGKAVFDQYCAGCHTVGGGDLAGPDLQGVADRRDHEWLERWLSEPDAMLAESDPIATELLKQYNNIPMPNQQLSHAEIDALLAYLGTGQPTAAPAAVAPALTGSAAAGKALFTGSDRLANGGTACIACHDSAGLGAPGGGTLGPDLTKAFTRYGGEAGLAGVLGTIPFVTMNPIYATRPLTPQEQADLVAFLRQADAHSAPNRTARALVLYLLAFAVMDVFVALLFFRLRQRPQRVRRSLVERAG
jgi:mono/diheme cytochrome c family protein